MEASTGKSFSLRAMMLIASPKLADKAEGLFHESGVPVLHRVHAVGTASSQMMDILGLGSIDKSMLIALLPTCAADGMLRTVYKKLQLNQPGSGIVCTLPLAGANALLFRMMEPMAEENAGKDAKRKEETGMTEWKHMLIAAVVNQGYSEQVMDAARAAGAAGGSVIHSRHIVGDGVDMSFWGLTVQEEKEMILIIADREKKLPIMKAIGEACGMRTEAQGLVVSLPIESVLGLGEVE